MQNEVLPKKNAALLPVSVLGGIQVLQICSRKPQGFGVLSRWEGKLKNTEKSCSTSAKPCHYGRKPSLPKRSYNFRPPIVLPPHRISQLGGDHLRRGGIKLLKLDSSSGLWGSYMFNPPTGHIRGIRVVLLNIKKVQTFASPDRWFRSYKDLQGTSTD